MQVSGMLSGNEAAASSLPGFKRLDAPGMLHMAERIVKEGGEEIK
jgi:hypothetical protein